MELYNAIGEEQLLLQAAITTYSGAMGSGALIGNMLSKNMAGDLYNLSLDQFSLDILQGTFDAVEKETLAGKTVGSMDRNFFQDADHAVWASKGMGDYFPGNIQFVDYKNHRDPEAAKKIYETIGTINAAQLGQEFMTLFSDIQGLGSRPADYSDKDGYRTIEGERFITVIDISTGSIEVFWDKNLPVNAEEWPSDIPMDLYSDDLKTFPPYFPVLNIIGELLSGKPIVPTQIENRPRNGWNLEKGNLVRAYVQAGNKHIADYDESLSYKNFGSVDADLLEISEEISEHDISPYFLRNKW